MIGEGQKVGAVRRGSFGGKGCGSAPWLIVADGGGERERRATEEAEAAVIL